MFIIFLTCITQPKSQRIWMYWSASKCWYTSESNIALVMIRTGCCLIFSFLIFLSISSISNDLLLLSLISFLGPPLFIMVLECKDLTYFRTLLCLEVAVNSSIFSFSRDISLGQLESDSKYANTVFITIVLPKSKYIFLSFFLISDLVIQQRNFSNFFRVWCFYLPSVLAHIRSALPHCCIY